MTAYQVVRAIQEGKRIYRVEMENKIRYIWAISIENAKSKFTGKWVISEYASLVVHMARNSKYYL